MPIGHASAPGQGLVKVGVTVRDRMAWWFRGVGRFAAGVPGRRGL
jgi:hypothetical protein